MLGEGDGAWTCEVEDLEGGEVDHAGVLTQVEVLGVDDGTPPTIVPLGFSLGQAVTLDKVGVSLVPVRTLPHSGRVVVRAGCVGLGLENRCLEVAARVPLLARVDDAVGLDEVLVGTAPDMVVAALFWVEASKIRCVRICLLYTSPSPRDRG